MIDEFWDGPVDAADRVVDPGADGLASALAFIAEAAVAATAFHGCRQLGDERIAFGVGLLAR